MEKVIAKDALQNILIAAGSAVIEMDDETKKLSQPCGRFSLIQTRTGFALQILQSVKNISYGRGRMMFGS